MCSNIFKNVYYLPSSWSFMNTLWAPKCLSKRHEREVTIEGTLRGKDIKAVLSVPIRQGSTEVLCCVLDTSSCLGGRWGVFGLMVHRCVKGLWSAQRPRVSQCLRGREHLLSSLRSCPLSVWGLGQMSLLQTFEINLRMVVPHNHPCSKGFYEM